ncbi:MAG: hypothetical protein CL916_12200 [Deltaproteobacteria bacterium]|nr:hypothetical protein [Deltaproteobacteria bacterium]
MKHWIGISFVWCMILHRPGLLSFGRAIPGSEQGDTIRGHWSAWFMAHDSTPLDTILCNWPTGASLLPLPPISLWIISPYTLLFGAAHALSVLVFLHSLLCVFGGFVLGRVLSFSKETSFLLGIFLSATPMLAETLSSGVYEYQTLGWVPLFFATLITTCKGKWIYAPLSALLYIILTLECGYYGSAAALAALFIVAAHTRSKKGFFGAIFSAIVLFGLSYGVYQIIAPALEKLSSSQMQAGGDFRVIMGTAELWALIPGISPPPPPPGMPDPFISAPPLIVWILFAGATIFSFRKNYWSSFIAVFFLGIATQSSWMSWWTDGPLGHFVQNLRRFAAPMTLMMIVTIAYSWEDVKTKRLSPTSSKIAGILYIVALLWSAQDALIRYPLLWLPKTPLFAQTIQQDTNPGAVLVFPQEQEGRKTTSHQYLRTNTSFSNTQARLWFQTQIDRPVHHYTKLATLIPKEGRRWQFDGGALNKVELQLLIKQGLRYILLDHTQLSSAQKQQTKGLISSLGYGCTSFDEWGGIDICLLTDR